MCGITGIFAFNEVGRINQMYLVNATRSLISRGPDFEDFYQDYYVGLGHRRLAIIDTSAKGNQPMSDSSGRYTIIYNGELYNFRELKHELANKGYSFGSDSDTEVLLAMYRSYGKECLNKLNGFFAFAIYDQQESSLFLARDRFGIKPLYYTIDEDRFIFASEMKALLCYGLKKEIDNGALETYLQLNYIPYPQTIFKNVNKCPPGCYLELKDGKLCTESYYKLSQSSDTLAMQLDYDQACSSVEALLDQSVQDRLVSDVPLGAFLSGGVDSSCITALASRHVDKLQTFSIGYQDEPFFDETIYAEQVANHLNTEHQSFKLTNYDLLKHLDDMVNYLDEPFADSSALPVYILSKETKKAVTVALSGDGADEIFSGYNKHWALDRSIRPGLAEYFVRGLWPLWRALPKSRNGRWSNVIRQLDRFAKGSNLSPEKRYLFWAAFNTEDQAKRFLTKDFKANPEVAATGLDQILSGIPENPSLNDFLLADTQLVLPNDMLYKVDMMSMANSLEVRVPFLDHKVVELAMSLPVDYKIEGKVRKRILRDAFKNVLPSDIFHRKKQGFEVPLLKWFRKELSSELNQVVFNREVIEDQRIFSWTEIDKLAKKLHSANPGDSHAKVWALYVFQKWWKNYWL